MRYTSRFHLVLAATLALGAGASHAGQPISKSMADCAGIFLAVSDVVETPHRKTFLLEVSRIWETEATKAAGRDMSGPVSQTAAVWRDKGAFVGFSSEFRDWMDYCRALAKHRKITLPPRP